MKMIGRTREDEHLNVGVCWWYLQADLSVSANQYITDIVPRLPTWQATPSIMPTAYAYVCCLTALLSVGKCKKRQQMVLYQAESGLINDVLQAWCRGSTRTTIYLTHWDPFKGLPPQHDWTLIHRTCHLQHPYLAPHRYHTCEKMRKAHQCCPLAGCNHASCSDRNVASLGR